MAFSSNCSRSVIWMGLLPTTNVQDRNPQPWGLWTLRGTYTRETGVSSEPPMHTVTNCMRAFLAHTCALQKLELNSTPQKYTLGKSIPGLCPGMRQMGYFMPSWAESVLLTCFNRSGEAVKYVCLTLKCWLPQSKEKGPCMHSVHTSAAH